MSHRTEQGLNTAEAARTELYDTLSLLSDRLNYAQRFDDAVDRTQAKISRSQTENPVGFALVVAGVAITVGVIAWAGASKLLNAFK